MHRLSPADYDRLLDCVRELHSFRDLPALRLWLITAALPRLIPSDWFSYNEVDLHSPQNTFTLLRPDAKVFKPLIPRFAELAHQHPIITRQLNQHDLAVRTIADFLNTSGTMTATPVHVYTPAGNQHGDSLGDVQRLPNGNTVVTYSNGGVILELDASWNTVQTLKGGFGYADWRQTLYGPPER